MGQLSSTGTAGTKQDNLVPTKTTRTYWGKCGYQDPIGQLGLNGATSLHPGLSRQLGQPVPNRTTGAFGITETPRISTRISTGTPSLLGSPGTPGSPLGHLRSVGAPGSAPRPQGLVLGPIGSTGPLGSAPGHCHPWDNQQPHDHPLDNRDLWDHQKCQDHPLTPKQLAPPDPHILLGSVQGSLTPKDTGHKHPWDNQPPRITGTPRITLQDLRGSITPMDIVAPQNTALRHTNTPRWLKAALAPFKDYFLSPWGRTHFLAKFCLG